MTTKDIMDVYSGHPFHIIIKISGKVDINPPKQENVCEVTNATQEIVHIKEEHFLYLSGAKETRIIAATMLYTKKQLWIVWNKLLNMGP